jgi:hypothetical protein
MVEQAQWQSGVCRDQTPRVCGKQLTVSKQPPVAALGMPAVKSNMQGMPLDS